MLQSNGSLVGVSSIAGYIGLPERSAYSASKFAMNGFLESVRSENMENDLHVLIACPGFTASNIRKAALTKDGTPQKESPRNEKKMMTAEKVAKNIVGEDVMAPYLSMGGEDFSYFAEKVPGCFFFLGTAPKNSIPMSVPQHCSHFNIEESAMLIGSSIFIQLACK